VYAVIESGGKQYRVTAGQTIDVDRVPAEPGETVTMGKVLLVGEGDTVKVGRPTVEHVSVSATVLKHGLKRKVIIWHFMPKQRYRVKRGFRQEYTRLRIDEIKE
jgi:large subunit ribosomal protein L21